MEKERSSVITICVIFSIIALIFAVGLIGLLMMEDYPNKEELVYEECTFISYEFKKSSKSKRYYIYVEEYINPLEIDNIVYAKADKEVLSSIEPGDKIKISVRRFKDDLKLYSVSYKEKNVLSYEDFLARHESNDKLGFIILPILCFMSLSIVIVTIVYYKKTGHCIPL